MTEDSLHVAFWCPMPPSASGIAQYGFTLADALRRKVRVSVVVPEWEIDGVVVPDGVGLLSSDEALHGHLDQPDLHLYHVGNHSQFHGWMLDAITTRPGIVVLHDLSLFDLYRGLCGPSPSLWEQVLTHGGYAELLSNPSNFAGVTTLDRTKYAFTHEVVQHNLCTIVHSQWAVEQLHGLYPESRIVHLPLASSLLEEAPAAEATLSIVPTIAILGGINFHKRVDIALRAFARAAHDRRDARLIVAGRSDQPALVTDLRSLIHDLGIDDQTRILLNISSEQFEQILRDSHLVVSLRWPTAGEMSAVLMQALGAGRPVLTSDVPQFAELDSPYVFRVTPNTPREVDDAAAIIRAAIDHPAETRQIGNGAREFVRSTSTWERVAESYVALIREYVGPLRSPATSAGEMGATATVSSDSADAEGILGLNVYGDWSATTGLAHAGRRLCVGLLHRGVPLTVKTVSSRQPRDASLFPPEFIPLAQEPSRPVDLWTLNINEFHLVQDADLRSPRTNRYHIATWYWELATIPEWLTEEFDRVDEIWAPTRFVQRVFERYTKKPVHVVPTTVPEFIPSADQATLRARLGLHDDQVMFLFTFDFNSNVGRKNPLGVLEAFTRAFPERGPNSPVLVLKTINMERDPEFYRAIEGGLANVGGLLINSHLSSQEMADLFTACDVYVSLHRSEGFGLGMAEAMGIGKPVIGTGYSGNLDFMDVTNSCLVGYRLCPITADDHAHNPGAAPLYPEGTLWAQPDIDQAVEWMRILAADQRLRDRIGQSGRQTISSNFSEEAVSRIAVSRLSGLNKELLGQRHPMVTGSGTSK